MQLLDGIRRSRKLVNRSYSGPKHKKYGDYKQALRIDFCYSCAFCSITEIEYGAGTFNIDHFMPRIPFKNLETEYGNLLWSCERCNKKKLSFYPGKDGRLKGMCLYRPDRFWPNDHFEMQDEVLLKSKTRNIGNFTIDRLDLNGWRLRRVRGLRKKHLKLKRFTQSGPRIFKEILREGKADKIYAGMALIKELKKYEKQFLEIIQVLAEEFASIQQDTKQDMKPLRKKLLETGAILPW
ncbi:MAG: HNH endonuclease [Candidatus Rifleibacteriota bacterium]